MADARPGPCDSDGDEHDDQWGDATADQGGAQTEAGAGPKPEPIPVNFLETKEFPVEHLRI
jgi:hypothetical protein